MYQDFNQLQVMTREERKTLAREHVEYMSSEYSWYIDNAVEHTLVLSDPVIGRPVSPTKVADIALTTLDTVHAMYRYAFAHRGIVTVLDFASYRKPGGGFMNGSLAQEESLCHASNLYNILGKKKKFYRDNGKRGRMNKYLYMNRSLFIPNVVFQPNDDFSAMISNVIVCAAPNWHEASKQGKATVDENDAALESRIRYVCDVAECARTDCMILGAFGCGVFEQDTERVASLFAKYLGRYNFERVVFALPDEKQYGEFAKVFSSQYHGHVDVQ